MKNEIIIGTYYVADCEHNGDIQREISYLRNIHHGIKIINSYWDGRDCGEAYIEFSFKSCYFVEIYNKVEATYNADINDYLPLIKERNSLLSNAKILSHKLFNELCNKYEYSFDNKNITLRLFFGEKTNISNETIISKAVEILGKETTNILAYSKYKVDGTNYVDVLIQTLISNINFKKLHDFGDYCLGSHGWLKTNHIYGEMRINSVLKDYCTNNDFISLIEKIDKKETLIFTDKNYYHPKTIEVSYNTYMGDNNIIIPKIRIDGIFYFLKLT